MNLISFTGGLRAAVIAATLAGGCAVDNGAGREKIDEVQPTALAEAFVSGQRDDWDYSIASLALVDRELDRQRERGFVEQYQTLTAPLYGSYVSKVLRRRLGGEHEAYLEEIQNPTGPMTRCYRINLKLEGLESDTEVDPTNWVRSRLLSKAAPTIQQRVQSLSGAS